MSTQDPDGPTGHGVLDFLTSIDNLIAEQTALIQELRADTEQLTGVRQQLDNIESDLGMVGEQLEGIGAELGAAHGRSEAYPHDFSRNVPQNTPRDSPVTRERGVPADGRIVGLKLGWPDGAQQEVGVQLRTTSGERFVPRNPEDEYIGFNDFNDNFTLSTPVTEGDTLVAEFVSPNAGNDHFINCVVALEEH